MIWLILVLIAIGILTYWAFIRSTKIVLTERAGEIITIRKFSFSLPLGLSILLILVLLILISSFKFVPVGHAIVKFNIITKTFSTSKEGLNFVLPFIYTYEIYDLRRQEYTMSAQKGEGRRRGVDDSLWSPTREGLQVGIDLTAWYRINPDSLIKVHRSIGKDFDEKVIRPAIRSIVRHVISGYTVMEVYSDKRLYIQEEIKTKIRELLEKDGFMIEEIVLRDVHFTPDFAKAIEDKQIAQQEAERMKYLLEKERLEAQRKEIEAMGRAKAIDIVSKELKKNPEYVKYLYVDKLSDKVKLIISNEGTILNIGNITKE